jgi:septal ring factor EnvC (AmiA/AmiB activator)
LEKVLDKQASKKFDIPSVKIGTNIIEGSVASRVIITGKCIIEECDSSMFGVNALEAGYPLFDEDNPDEIVGLLDIITPKEVAVNLRDMSNNLENNLTGIASAIQQLAASASEIHINEQELNTEIKDIITILEKINEISSFIKEIADRTKMLGLNAAIEAAKAGEAGKGFGVVAKEIRKLSEQSKSAVPIINKFTENIKLKVKKVSDKSMSSLASSQEQASVTEEITASIEEITVATEELNKIAHNL